jgi:hypothetical protein
VHMKDMWEVNCGRGVVLKTDRIEICSKHQMTSVPYSLRDIQGELINS